MNDQGGLFPIRLIRLGFAENGVPRAGFVLSVLVLGVVQAAFVYAGSYLDSTLYLFEEGDGFLEHYGVWAILATDPLLLIATSFAYRRFFMALENMPVREDDVCKEHFDVLTKPFLRAVTLQNPYFWVYALLVIIGLLGWVNNLRQTIDPIAVYGNDVFDAYYYQWGYYANKINLFYSWVVVYPLVGYLLVAMSVSIRFILVRSKEAELLQLTVVHPDGSYGLFNLGILNIALLVPYVLSFSVVYMLLLTHETTYASVIVALGGLSFALVAASFLTIGPISALGRRAQEEAYEKLENQSKTYNADDDKFSERFAFERLCYVSAKASPYSSTAQVIINSARLIPVVLTASYRLFA